MTSTGTFKGLGEGRNSSKVLKPPGGGSSDIFGTGQEEISPRRVKNHTQSQLGSQLFGGNGGSSTGSSSPETPRSNKPDGNPVTGTGYSDQQNNVVASQNGSSAGSVNGDIKSSTDSSPNSNKPARTRVPPGGYSSGLW